MTEVASYSFDNVKLIVISIILAAVCITGVGLIPVGILLLGLIISIKGGDVKNIHATTRLIQVGVFAVSAGLLVFAFYQNMQANHIYDNMGVNPLEDPQYEEVRNLGAMALYENSPLYEEYFNRERKYSYDQGELERLADLRDGLFVGSFAVFLCAFVLNFLWLKPLERRFAKMKKAAEDFANREKKSPPPSIINRESLTSYSTADELKKWLALRHDGAISESEYQEARAKILNQR